MKQTYLLEAKASGFVMKNHLTATYQYIRAENSSTTSIQVYSQVLWNENQRKKHGKISIFFTIFLFCFELSFLTYLSELWFVSCYDWICFIILIV